MISSAGFPKTIAPVLPLPIGIASTIEKTVCHQKESFSFLKY